ncbi:methyltransferase family protein [Mesorhizobium muleiense]|uniref:methyltransferase family protein n=1 Tax=Mesorhizobium muleiense TaxID=1004279 RepID=UPI001F24B33A|nr:isoprenylcysteine carboxylmethyltransferase family protein [Mesorhizobium muleiense]MCF6112172.1 isoprenylcysteine carboxylmethyltransferase family protein [Mesorhizobium muleiense]
MKLRDRFGRDGAFLFRWRSYLPLLLLGFAIPALFQTVQVEQYMGAALTHVWVYFCIAVSYLGLLVRCLSIGFIPAGTSGRGTKRLRADVLNITGMYSIVRNPLYLGNFLAMLGIAMSLMVWWLVAVFLLAYWLYIERIIWTEEEFLSAKFGQSYDEWSARTPAFIPNVLLWKSADLSFSLRTVLRREYHGALAIAAAYFCLEAILDLAIERQGWSEWVVEDYVWIYLFLTGIMVYAMLMILKKRTNLLSVPGRE